jgi:hypothetical protein
MWFYSRRLWRAADRDRQHREGDRVSRYGRTDEEWDALQAAGWEFLVSQARLQRTTSYTETNTVLAPTPRKRS